MASRIDPRLHYQQASQYPPRSQQYPAPPPPPPPSAHHHQLPPPPPASYPSSSSYPGYHEPSPPDPSARSLPRITPGPSSNGGHAHQQQPQLRSSAPPPQHSHPHHHQQQQHHPYYPLGPQPQPSPPPARPESPLQAHQLDLDDSPLDGSFVDPNDPKRARACESCRGLKVRCDRDPNNKDQPCLRCAKAKRPCVVTEPSRKRQKKTDSRVAELERKIERLSALLPAHVQELESPQQQEANEDSTASDSALSPASSKHIKRRRTTTSPSQDSTKSPIQSAETREFVTARRERKWSGSVEASEKRFRPPHATIPEGCNPPEDYDADAPEPVSAFVRRRTAEIVDDDTAAEIFEHYVVNMAVHMPAIVFPAATRATDIRESRPLLFLSILVAASVGRAPQAMQFELHALLLSTLADSLIGNVEKGLDVVQALLVATIWYRPPRRYEQMNFYQLAHSAAVMAIDIGLGKRSPVPKPHPNPAGQERQTAKQATAMPDSLEIRRTWLGCYFQCAQISMCLRRPPLIRWTNYLEESVELLETSGDAFESDKLLCQHVKLQHLSEQVGHRFSMDDPSAQISITDPKIQDSIRAFEVELSSWRKSAEKVIWNSMPPRAMQKRKQTYSPWAVAQLEISEKVVSLYMHETALHSGHNVDDFRAPFTEEMVRASAGQGLSLSPAHSTALLVCLRAVHAIFDNFFTFDLAVVRNLPIFFFVRVGYAVVVLARLHFAVMAPNSDISKLISQEDVAVESYFGRLLKTFQTVHEQESFRPATRFLVIVRRLVSYFAESRQNEGKKGKGSKQEAGQKRQRNEVTGATAGSSSSNAAALDIRASTPLDLLSQVATAGVDGQSSVGAAASRQAAALPQAKVAGPYQNQNNSMWYGGNVTMPNMGPAGSGDFGVGMDFTSAIDMTLSGVIDDTSDLSWLFNDGYGESMWPTNG